MVEGGGIEEDYGVQGRDSVEEVVGGTVVGRRARLAGSPFDAKPIDHHGRGNRRDHHRGCRVRSSRWRRRKDPSYHRRHLPLVRVQMVEVLRLAELVQQPAWPLLPLLTLLDLLQQAFQ